MNAIIVPAISPRSEGGNLEAPTSIRHTVSLLPTAIYLGCKEYRTYCPLEENARQFSAIFSYAELEQTLEGDIEKRHLHFPEISGPHSPEICNGTSIGKNSLHTMQLIAPTDDFNFDDSQYLCYYRYRAIEFLSDPKDKKKYSGRNMDADRFSRRLAKIMQINLVKRLESSFSAFKTSLRNLRQYTENMIDMWDPQ